MAKPKAPAKPKTSKSDFPASAPDTAAKDAKSNTFLDSIAITDDSVDLEGFKQLSLPPIIKPRQMVGRTIIGEIVEIMASPNKDMKNKLLKLKHNDKIFCFPITASVNNALELYCGGELDDEKLVGKTVLIKGLGKTPLASGKTVNVFEVYVKG